MAAPDPLSAPFRNEGLFADHYLQHVLPRTPSLWALEGMDEARDQVRAIWEREQAKVSHYNEMQLCKHFVTPVLEALGHVVEEQPLAGQHQPDYAFFADDAARVEVLPADGRAAYWAEAIAVGDAKTWERRLDRAVAGQAGWDFQNPSFQVGQYYLAETGCKWAVLTNGRHWRLYSAEPKPDMQRFFEVDLPALLEADDPEDFAYFWLFLRREAFVPDLDGQTFLGRVRAESDEAAARLRDNVREAVYRALLEACRGFLAHAPNKLTDGDLREVYDNALVFLYRLLFVLYAEAARLLPLAASEQYRESYSLHAIKHDVEAKLGTYIASATALWQRLAELFRIIDQGEDALGVPAYNGGLFDTGKHPRLESWRLGDSYVAEVVDLLACTDDPKTGERRFVDYRDLGVRHLGSIYEGLLEYRLARASEPMVVAREGGKDLWVPEAALERPAPGAERCETGDLYLVTDRGERKATGSYYTPQFVVEYIVEHTLGPVVEKCTHAEAILALKVLDPAMGSGHFLVEATDYLARKLLECPLGADGTGRHMDAPERGSRQYAEDEADLARAKRAIVERCIYGVDINPLAVELAKVSLWLGTVAQGQPLSFLDHHLRCGNSLIGARITELPLPPKRRKRPTSRAARLGEYDRPLFDEGELLRHTNQLVIGLAEIMRETSDTREAVHSKGRLLEETETAHRRAYREIGDLWCSRCFGNEYSVSTYNAIVQYLQGRREELSRPRQAAFERSRALAEEYRFFHWDLEFPEVFLNGEGRPREQGGFDAVIGNPPWERIKLQENEFFARRAPQVALAPTAARRKAAIAELRKRNPGLWSEYEGAKSRADLELAWTRSSGQFPLMGRGDTNLYAVMAERSRSLLAPHGRAGLVVPSGIATDSTTADFFADLVGTRSLQTLLDFENREGLFPDLHRSFKFSIVILTGGETHDEIVSGFFLHNPDDMRDPERVFPLQPDDCARMNPNTLTCPILRSRRDAEVTGAIYQRVPVLLRRTAEGEQSPWGIRYLRMFDMTNDSGLFHPAADLEARGFWLSAGNVWRKAQEAYVPLYEGKMVQMYDHRAAGVVVNPANVHRPASPQASTLAQHEDVGYSPTPQFWVSEREVRERVGDGPGWFVAFKDVTAPTNERTMIAAGVPRAALGNKLPCLLPSRQPPRTMALLLANLCSIPFDYVARQKVGGQTLNLFIVEQLPVLPPSRYEEEFGGVLLRDFVGERVLELTYTAHDIAAFAEDMGYVDETGKVKPPFEWDEERRLHLRCQLDALYFHLYGLTREEADYVLETFPIVKRRDEAQFGRFRTKDLILQYWAAYAAGDMDAWAQA